MDKDVGWKTFFEDNQRYADIINGIGCKGKQLIKDTDLQVADSAEKKNRRDLLRRVALGVNFLIIGLENQEKVDYKIHIVDICRLEDTSVFQTDVRQVFDFIRYSKDKNKLLDLIQSDSYYSKMDEDALEVVTMYTNINELIKSDVHQVEGGKTDVCQAIRDLMNDSKEEGRAIGVELNKIENAKNLLDILSDEVISERIHLTLAEVQALRAEQVKEQVNM